MESVDRFNDERVLERFGVFDTCGNIMSDSVKSLDIMDRESDYQAVINYLEENHEQISCVNICVPSFL